MEKSIFSTLLTSIKNGYTTYLGMADSKNIFPAVKAADAEPEAEEEVELVDPQAELREQCAAKPAMQNLYSIYQTCNDRVNSRTKTTETCMEELFDYLHELDHCVGHSLWSRLK